MALTLRYLITIGGDYFNILTLVEKTIISPLSMQSHENDTVHEKQSVLIVDTLCLPCHIRNTYTKHVCFIFITVKSFFYKYNKIF